MNTKRLTFVLLLAALLVAAQPLFAQLDEDFGSSSSDWPVPQWTQLTGLLGSTPASGAQWFQDDWLNLANSTNKSAKINIYGSSRNGWLVTAPVAIPDPGFELAFDLGLMAWNRNVAITPGAQPDDRFIVLMSSSPSMANPILLREWNNSGSPHVFDQIPSGGIRISIPLSGVSGNKYFAFYGESTLVNGDNDLMIDNVSINRIPLYPSFSYVPAFLDFGTCRFGMPTAPQLLQITNTGGNILDIIPSDLSISGPDATMFSYDPQVLPVALSSGQSVSIPLVFNPLGVGPRSAILQIVNNQTRSLYEIPLSGVSLPEDIVPIGQGNIDLDMPINPYWGYSYSQSIFLQSEINVPNQQIEKLYFYWNGAANADASNVWNVMMGHTTLSEFPSESAWIPCSNLAPVFSGEISLPASPGWIEINLDFPFVYNNVDNLLVAVDENEPGYNGSSEFFFGSNTASYRSLRFFSDSTNPDPQAPPNGTRVQGHPNIRLRFDYLPIGPPHPVMLLAPAPGAMGMDVDGFELRWAPADDGGVPLSYNVFMAPAEAEIFDHYMWQTTTLCFNPVSQGQMTFALGERWYWTVEAVNADGSAVRLPARWFEIDPLIQSFPYLVDFEDHADNTLPPGWERSSLSLGWKTGNDLSSDYWSIPPHSIYAAANDDAAGSGANGSMDLLMMPQMDFSASAGSPMLSFDSFYPGDYGQLAKVEASTDGTTWSLVHSLTPNAAWIPVSVDLSAYAGLNPVFIRFHSDDSGIWASGWAIDNVCLVFSPGLDTPTLEISFDANGLRLSWNAVDGASTYRVEASPTPMLDSSWQTLGSTANLHLYYSGNLSPLFFRVKALAAR